MSGRYRDDLTVTVVFFGEPINPSSTDGSLVTNPEGTTPPKPKL
ncbi:hypothetical protein Kpol_1029p14, partial [Vanderwaltozyma polyspora DSM 70294]